MRPQPPLVTDCYLGSSADPLCGSSSRNASTTAARHHLDRTPARAFSEVKLAFVLAALTRTRGVMEVVEVPEPDAAGQGELIVRPEAVGLCGSTSTTSTATSG